MYYIAPAWSDEIKELTHDPLNSLINLLLEGNKEVKIAILNFLPNLRYILHENNLTDSDYWNVWDTILNIQRTDGMPLAPENLDLPNGAELIYSNNSISAYVDDVFYAKILVNEKGYVTEIQVDYNGERRTDIYDDRGFKIQSKYYQANTITQMDWFNEAGQKVIQYVESAELQIRIVAEQERFDREQYADIDDLLLEITSKMLQQEFQISNDIFIASTDASLKSLMLQIQNKIPLNYVYGHAGYLEETTINNFVPQIKGSSYFFVDNHYTLEQLQDVLDQDTQAHLKLGYPYGTAMRLGNSNEEKKLVVYWNAGETTVVENSKLTANLLIQYMIQHPDVTLLVETEKFNTANIIADEVVGYFTEKYRFISDDQRSTVKSIIMAKNRNQLVRDFIFKIQGQVKQSAKSGEQFDQTVDWDEFLSNLNDFKITINSKSYEIFAALEKARILIDMGEPYDTLTQLNAISAGIPQINIAESPLVTDQRNGWVVTDQRTLIQGLDYFLGELGNWNRSLVDSVQYMEQFAKQRQADWWERKLYGKKK
jgi:accessory secretory protein Asp1